MQRRARRRRRADVNDGDVGEARVVERGERVRAELGPLVRDRLGQRRELRVRLRRQLAWQLAEAPRVHRVGERRQVAQRGVEDAVDEDHLPPGRVRREPRLERSAGREPRRPHRPRREDRRHVGPPPRLALRVGSCTSARTRATRSGAAIRTRSAPPRSASSAPAPRSSPPLPPPPLETAAEARHEGARRRCPGRTCANSRRGWLNAYAILLARRERQNQQGDAAAPRRRCHFLEATSCELRSSTASTRDSRLGRPAGGVVCYCGTGWPGVFSLLSR